MPTETVDPSSAVCRYRSLALCDGWLAQVLATCHGMALLPDLEKAPPDDADWRALLEPLIEGPSALSEYALLKYADGGEVLAARWSWKGATTRVVAKQSRPRGWRRGLSALLRGTRARRNFGRALALLQDGIKTPVPLALLERRGSRREDWLVCPFISGLTDLDGIALTGLPRVEPGALRRVKDRIILRVAELFARLQRSDWYHRDLKASNILLTQWDRDDACVWLVDLDGLFRRRRSAALNLRPVVRLGASLLSYPLVTTTDGARFVRCLLTSIRGTAVGWREVLRTVSAQAHAYNRRAAKRKHNKLDGFNGA